MDGSLIVILGFPVLYLTGSLRRATAQLKVSGSAFVLYFAATAALLLLPTIYVSYLFSVNIAGVFYCLAPVAVLIRRREFPLGLPIAAALCVLFSCTSELLFGDYTMDYLPYAEGALIAAAALCCIQRKAALFVPVLAALYEAAGHTVRLLSGMDYTPWFSGLCMTSVAIGICVLAAAVKLPARHTPRHAELKGGAKA